MDTRKWTSQIDEITDLYKEAFGAMSNQALNKKPSQEEWSIAQNLDHLITINKSYYSIPDKIRANNYKLPRVATWSFFAKTVGNMILGSVERSRKRKTKTFPVWEPSADEEIPNIYREFLAEQEQLKAWIRSIDDLLEKDVVIGSPANQNICYKLTKALDIIVEHERRHFKQCVEVKEAI